MKYIHSCTQNDASFYNITPITVLTQTVDEAMRIKRKLIKKHF